MVCCVWPQLRILQVLYFHQALNRNLSFSFALVVARNIWARTLLMVLEIMVSVDFALTVRRYFTGLILLQGRELAWALQASGFCSNRISANQNLVSILHLWMCHRRDLDAVVFNLVEQVVVLGEPVFELKLIGIC